MCAYAAMHPLLIKQLVDKSTKSEVIAASQPGNAPRRHSSSRLLDQHSCFPQVETELSCTKPKVWHKITSCMRYVASYMRVNKIYICSRYHCRMNRRRKICCKGPAHELDTEKMLLQMRAVIIEDVILRYLGWSKI